MVKWKKQIYTDFLFICRIMHPGEIPVRVREDKLKVFLYFSDL